MPETKPCVDCRGSGDCLTCEGDGYCLCDCEHCGAEVDHDCNVCDGSGQCVTCGGTGEIPVTDSDREALGQLRLPTT